MQTIIALDCIPAGMEWFPAIDEEQFFEECFLTIKVQLLALGIIDEESIKNKIWVLSAKGFQMMMNERAVKTQAKYRQKLKIQ